MGVILGKINNVSGACPATVSADVIVDLSIDTLVGLANGAPPFYMQSPTPGRVYVSLHTSDGHSLRCVMTNAEADALRLSAQARLR